MTDDDLRAFIDEPALRRNLPAVEVAEALLRRLDKSQPRFHAMISLTAELALDAARDIDRGRARGDRLPLDGMPLVLKDNVDVAGIKTTVGSRLFADRVADADAEVTRRLRQAGAVVLGKANMHELAFGATSANETFGHVVNPAAPDRIPGGSSGGSGAAVAADLCVAAIGTDTGGSVRLPASLCGVAGLRPTFGAVSNRGVHPVSASLDTVGPLARSVRDVRDVLGVIAGFDPGDPTSADQALELEGESSVVGLRVGVIEALVERADPAVAARVLDVGEALRTLGASLSPVGLPNWEAASEACGDLVRAEALAFYRDVLTTQPELLEEGTRRRFASADDLDSVGIDALREERSRWARQVDAVLTDVDLLLLPTIAIEPPTAEGAETVGTTNAVVPYTFVMAFAHVPALSIPCGVTPTGAPVGAQLVARRWHDGVALRAGAAVQAVTDWHRRRPVLVS